MSKPSAKQFDQVLAQPLLVYVIYAINLIVITWFWWTGNHLEARTFHGLLTILGRYAGLVSAYAALWQLLLIGRMPVIKQALGMEKEFKLHRWNGYITIYALLAHIVLLVAGYALTTHLNIWLQLVDFVFNYQDVFNATVGSILMIGLVVMSMVIVRRHLKYETWYLIHLSSYLAIVLAFGHQLSTGGTLIRQHGFALYWQALYIVTFGLIGLVRLALPLWVWQQQRFRVERVVQEAKDIFSIYVSGRHLDQFQFQPGQFGIWHFLLGSSGWQGHPFSFSSQPDDQHLRITFKDLGDYTHQLKDVKPGTPVIIEGPFGKFTSQQLKGSKVLLIAGGIGLTPLASMLPGLVKDKLDISLIYAARTRSELALRSELEQFIFSGVKIQYLTDDGSLGLAGQLDKNKLAQLAPDLKTREIFLCGPPPMMAAVSRLLISQGVPPDHIYTERFSLHTKQ